MGIRISSVGVGYYGVWLLAFIAFGLWSLFRWVDHGLNYTEVPAVVDRVAFSCRPTSNDSDTRAVLDRHALWAHGAWGPCSDAEAFARRHARTRVTRSQTATVRYVSPADGREHRGLVHLHGADQKTVRAGARLAIYAHDSEPLTIDPA